MLRSEKKDFVEKLDGIYASAKSVIVTHYHGLCVSDITKLRKEFRSKGVGFQIAKNTLSKVALGGSELSDISHFFKGPTAIAYSIDDPVAAAKSVIAFAKDNDDFKVVGGIVEGQILDVQGVSKLASLPSLEELRGQIIGLLQAPASKLVGVLQAPASGLVRVIAARS